MKKITLLFSVIALTFLSFNSNAQCPDPTIGAPTNLSATTATLNWTENGSATTWDIELVEGFPTAPTGTATHPGVTTNPFNITGLTPSTIYKVYVRSNCNGSTSAWVGFVFLATTSSASTCDTPVNISATNIASTSADLGWSNGTAGTPSSWIIEYGTTGFAQGTGAGTEVTATSNPFNLTGLNENTVYDFYIRADCGTADGLSPWSDPATSFTTLSTSGVNTITNSISINVFPNPSFGSFTLNVNTNEINELGIKIINTQGQVVFTKNNFENITTIQEQIELGNNANGVYILMITSNKGIATHRIIVQ